MSLQPISTQGHLSTKTQGHIEFVGTICPSYLHWEPYHPRYLHWLHMPDIASFSYRDNFSLGVPICYRTNTFLGSWQQNGQPGHMPSIISSFCLHGLPSLLLHVLRRVLSSSHTTSPYVHNGHTWCISAHRNLGVIPTSLDSPLSYGFHNMSAPTSLVWICKIHAPMSMPFYWEPLPIPLVQPPPVSASYPMW